MSQSNKLHILYRFTDYLLLQCYWTAMFWWELFNSQRCFPPFCTCYDIPVLMLNYEMIAVISQIPVRLFLTTNIWNTVQGRLGINKHCAMNKSLLSLRELTYGNCSCRSNCWHRELESSAKDNHGTVFEVVCAWLAFPTAQHFSRQGFWLQITWMLNVANLRTDFQVMTGFYSRTCIKRNCTKQALP